MPNSSHPYSPPSNPASQLEPFPQNEEEVTKPRFRSIISEDWLAIIVGSLILVVVLISAWLWGVQSEKGLASPWKAWLVLPGEWQVNPWTSIKSWPHLLGSLIVCIGLGLIGSFFLGRPQKTSLLGVSATVLLAALAYVLSGQQLVKYYNLEFALWALVLGLIISNTVGAPGWLRSVAMTEFYIKTGLVLLGAEILFGQLLALGLPGICVAWIVTPIVLMTTFWFGQRVLKMESASLNMVISADMSVCGVSAAIATAAACKAKKEELSLAVGLSLSFTVVMMIVLPAIIRALGLSEVLGGAWLGGTIDSTGAVVAAGAMLGDTARDVAATVKMIQNILIGVVAFGVAWYWVRYQQPSNASNNLEQTGFGEVWRRFPRFILGFLGASIAFSVLNQMSAESDQLAQATIAVTKTIRGWLFCLAFVCIGIETNFAELGRHMKGGKPMILYLSGQMLNLCLTLLMAWLAFEVWFPQVTSQIEQVTK